MQADIRAALLTFYLQPLPRPAVQLIRRWRLLSSHPAFVAAATGEAATDASLENGIPTDSDTVSLSVDTEILLSCCLSAEDETGFSSYHGFTGTENQGEDAPRPLCMCCFPGRGVLRPRSCGARHDRATPT